MNEKEILASSLSKAEKARQLFDLGKTNKEVADLVLGGNAGWAFNIRKAHNEKKLREKSGTHAEAIPPQTSQVKQPEGIANQNTPKSKPGLPATKVQASAQKVSKPKASVKSAAKKTATKKAVSSSKGKAVSKPKSKKGLRR